MTDKGPISDQDTEMAGKHDQRTRKSDKPTYGQPDGTHLDHALNEGSAPDPLIGIQVGNYHVVDKLGAGGFGAVYRGHDIKLDRDVALKFLRDPLAPKHAELFVREAKAIAALGKHSGIVQIYEWGEYRGQYYVALEFVGPSVYDLLKDAPNGLEVIRSLHIALECAEGLACAHGQKIYHRDIKPANILIDAETGKAKIADFGLARVAEGSQLSMSGAISGSPPYMSPEQANGKHVDGRSDIFSLGVALYQMLTGNRPFEGASTSEIMDKVRNNIRVPLRERRADLPGCVVGLVEQAMAHEPEARFQTAKATADAIQAVLDTLEKGAPEPKFELPRPLRRRKPLALAVTAAVVVAVIAVTLISLRSQGTLPTAPALAQAKDLYHSGKYDEALKVFKEIEASSSGTPDAAYASAFVAMINDKQDVARREEIRAGVERVKGLMEKNSAQTAPSDTWTSRPLTLCVLPVDAGTSPLASESGLADVLAFLLDGAIRKAGSIKMVDRQVIEEVLQEQALSAQLSSDSGKLRLGQVLGARFLLDCHFNRAFEKDYLFAKVVDIETTVPVLLDRMSVSPNLNPDDWTNSLADRIWKVVETAYPLQGKLAKTTNGLELNIGGSVGVKEGMRFQVRTAPGALPKPGWTVTVDAAVGPDSSGATPAGFTVDDVPEGGLFVSIEKAVKQGDTHGPA